MHKLKFNVAILGLLLSFVTIAADNSIINDGDRVSLTGGTHTARVIAPKAIVYSDENMLSPLGYIPNGKAIIVGNPRRMNRELVPLVVYGKLAFIELKDIRFEDTADEEYNAKRGAPREHDFDIILERPEEKLSENNSVFLGLQRYAGGEEVKNLLYNLDGSDDDSMSGFVLQFIHRKDGSRIFWGAALDYSSASTKNVRFGYWMVSPTLGWAPIRNKLFGIDIYGSLDLSFNSTIEVNNNYDNDPTGFTWGPQVGARFLLFPESKWHAYGAITYRTYNISGLETVQNSSGINIDGVKNVSAVSLSLGIGMEFR